MFEELKKKVKKEMDNIAEKGLTSSNLEATYKLVDIYKDIVEICEKEGSEISMYDGRREYDYHDYGARSRDSRGRYMESYRPMDERYERYMQRMREGMEDYNEGRDRYRDGGSNERMVRGVEMTMGAIVNFIESLMDLAETSQEKEIVKKYVNKIRSY